MKGFKSFLLRGDVIVLAVGFVVATAFSNLIKAFTTDVIQPLVNRAQGGGSSSQGLGIQLGSSGNAHTFINFGDLIQAIIYFLIFMAVIYFVLVVPYKKIMARKGNTVFGDEQTCPECKSNDLPLGATKCKYCGSALAA